MAQNYVYSFSIKNYEERVRVWRREGERFFAARIAKHGRNEEGSIMVWKGAAYGNRDRL